MIDNETAKLANSFEELNDEKDAALAYCIQATVITSESFCTLNFLQYIYKILCFNSKTIQEIPFFVFMIHVNLSWSIILTLFLN